MDASHTAQGVPVKAVVSVFYDRVLADDQLAAYFEGVDLRRLRAHQRAFLTAALGGPDLFAGRDMATAHAPMGIDESAFDAVVEHLVVSLHDLGVDDAVIAAVGERLAPLRSQIVTR